MFDKNFMLMGETAKKLYEEVVKDAPIYDYHCHLSPKEIYEDEQFSDITEMWLGFDHYKWRALRIAGVNEELITGNANNLDKFKAWAKVCERLIGSPLYHWANMELKEYFGIDEFLKERNAEEIYNKCNDEIKVKKLSPRKMISNSNVQLVCTTDDPIDDLKYHKLLGKENIDFKVLPTFRPDKSLSILKKDFNDYVEQLGNICNIEITKYSDLMDALKIRIKYFVEAGCLLSDHSLERLIYLETNLDEVSKIFEKRLNGQEVSIEESEKYKFYTLELLAAEYHDRGWVMQLHIGAMRNNNAKMFDKLGMDMGFDIMNDFPVAEQLSALLNKLDTENKLPKTILYTLNAKDNLVLSTLPHCYPEDGVPAKVQFGVPWWFNDNKKGMHEHLEDISNQGILTYFIGMLTDSRSLLSYVRHDYFRRILVSFIGELVDNGEFENDMEILTEIVEGVSYKNIEKYLGLD